MACGNPLMEDTQLDRGCCIVKSSVFLENLRHEGTIPIQAWLYAEIDALVGVPLGHSL